MNEFRDLREAAWRPGVRARAGIASRWRRSPSAEMPSRLDVSPRIVPVSGFAVQAQADASFGDVRAQLQLVQRDPVFLLSSFGTRADPACADVRGVDRRGPSASPALPSRGASRRSRLCPGATVRLLAPAHLGPLALRDCSERALGPGASSSEPRTSSAAPERHGPVARPLRVALAALGAAPRAARLRPGHRELRPQPLQLRRRRERGPTPRRRQALGLRRGARAPARALTPRTARLERSAPACLPADLGRG